MSVPASISSGEWTLSWRNRGETENASNICISIPFLHSLQPEHSRSSTFEGYENNSGFLWEKNLEENQANSRWKQTFATFIMHTGILPDNTCSVRFYCPWLLHRSWGWLSSRTPWSHPSASSLSREFLEVALTQPTWFFQPRVSFVLLLEGQIVPTWSLILPWTQLGLAQSSHTPLAWKSYVIPILSSTTRPSVMPSWVLIVQSCFCWMPCPIVPVNWTKGVSGYQPCVRYCHGSWGCRSPFFWGYPSIVGSITMRNISPFLLFKSSIKALGSQELL